MHRACPNISALVSGVSGLALVNPLISGQTLQLYALNPVLALCPLIIRRIFRVNIIVPYLLSEITHCSVTLM